MPRGASVHRGSPHALKARRAAGNATSIPTSPNCTQVRKIRRVFRKQPAAPCCCSAGRRSGYRRRPAFVFPPPVVDLAHHSVFHRLACAVDMSVGPGCSDLPACVDGRCLWHSSSLVVAVLCEQPRQLFCLAQFAAGLPPRACGGRTSCAATDAGYATCFRRRTAEHGGRTGGPKLAGWSHVAQSLRIRHTPYRRRASWTEGRRCC